MTAYFRPTLFVSQLFVSKLFVSNVSVLNASYWWRYRTIEGARAGV